MTEPHLTRSFGSAYVLMQYTGLHDKNGTEIYEGDIVRIHPMPEEPQVVHGTAEVYWDNGNAEFGLRPIRTNNAPEETWAGWSEEFWEVLGNHFENPELR